MSHNERTQTMERSEPHLPASTETTSGIDVRDLTKNYGESRAVDAVSFRVPEGSFCTLLGSSGSGKSTILRMLAGLDRPDGGEAWIAGKQVSGPGVFVPPEKRSIGFVFQAYALWPHMTVFDQIAYPLKLRRWRRGDIQDAVKRISETLGLDGLAHRYPSELSGGQQQRVALARALVVQPSVLFLDEPLSNLDAALRQQMRRELEEIQKRADVTTIYVTHDQEEAMAISDMVVLLDHGKVIEIGDPRSIYEEPKHAYTAKFVGSSMLFAGTLARKANGTADVTLPGGIVVTGRGDPSTKVGGSATVAIKPIDVVPDIDRRARGNTLDAEIVAATFLGPSVELRLSVLGSEVVVPMERHHAIRVGEKMRLHLPPERVVVLGE